MGKYSYYDEKEDVIFTDITGIASVRSSVDTVIDEVIAIARSLPKRVFIVVCWQDVKMDAVTAQYYGERVADLLKNYVRGIVRYGANDVQTRINIRTETVRHHTQGSRSYLYPTKEEALAALRRGEVKS